MIQAGYTTWHGGRIHDLCPQVSRRGNSGAGVSRGGGTQAVGFLIRGGRGDRSALMTLVALIVDDTGGRRTAILLLARVLLDLKENTQG